MVGVNEAGSSDRMTQGFGHIRRDRFGCLWIILFPIADMKVIFAQVRFNIIKYKPRAVELLQVSKYVITLL
jgi:hypothetical protein